MGGPSRFARNSLLRGFQQRGVLWHCERATQYLQTGAVSNFTMSETVNVQSTRLAAMQNVVGVSNHLLSENIPFIAQQPEYTFNGLKKLRPTLTAEAAANARKRAQAALGKNVQLGTPISITVGQVSVDAPGSVNYGSGTSTQFDPQDRLGGGVCHVLHLIPDLSRRDSEVVDQRPARPVVFLAVCVADDVAFLSIVTVHCGARPHHHQVARWHSDYIVL